MIGIIIEMLSYDFLVRALIVGTLVSICSSLLGVTLVLKRYSMIGDGLSHVGFGALAVASAFGLAPLAVAIPIVVLAAFLLLRISEDSSIKGDSAVALLSTGSLAIGVLSVSLSKNANTDVLNYMFGSILAMNALDVKISIILSIAVIILYIFLYNKVFVITFDEAFSRATGVRVNAYNMLIAFLTAITIVIGMRLMGALLISSLVIFPALTSMRIFKRFKSVTISSVCIAVVCLLLGMAVSYVLEVPTGASVVVINILAFLIFSIISLIKRGL